MLLVMFLAIGNTDGSSPTSDSDWALQRRRQIDRAQSRLVAPLTTSGFSEPIALLPSVYRKLLAEYEAARPDHTSLEPVGGYLSAKPRTHLTRLQDLVLAEVDVALRPVVEQWAGVGELELTGLYGVRTYFRGATLEPHVDRLSHAVSAIVQV